MTNPGVDRDTFRWIFMDHWEEFKKHHPGYDTVYYEEVVQKMLGCGTKAAGYSEYRCMHCGKDRRCVCLLTAPWIFPKDL
jgi:hypothetical protein